MSENLPPNSSSDDKSPKDFDFPSLHNDVSEKKEEVTPPEVSVPAVSTENFDPSPVFPNKFQRIKANLISWFMKNKQLGLLISFIAIAGLMFIVYKIRQHEPKEKETSQSASPDEIPVNVMEVRLGRFQDPINAVGTLKGEAEIELRFEVDGKITEFNVTEGAKVSKGQVIARLSDRDALLKVRRAQNELTNMEKLFELGGVSRTKLDEARLNLDIAQTELDKTKIIATRDGILGDKGADIGEFVTPQRKIATLVAIRHVVVKVGIIEKQVDKVYPGQKILVSVDAYPGNIFEGTIESISPIITGESKTFEITAKIPNPDSLLLPGMFARSKIITFELDDAMTVPNEALIKTTGGFQVFTVNKDNVATAVDVEPGYVSTELTQIKAGLTPGDIVIVQRPPELKAGSKVKVIEVQK